MHNGNDKSSEIVNQFLCAPYKNDIENKLIKGLESDSKLIWVCLSWSWWRLQSSSNDIINYKVNLCNIRVE